MNEKQTYASPAAFRTALTDKLRAKAETSRWTLQQLQRQMAYDRLLERLLHSSSMRDGSSRARLRCLPERSASAPPSTSTCTEGYLATWPMRNLRKAAGMDIDDWFRFELGARQAVADAAMGVRIPITAYVGATVWVSFHVDLVGSDVRMTGQPEDVPPLARVAMPNVEQHGYRAYPLVDHIADKVAAMFEVHGEMGRPSTRYRDVVDLVAIAIAAPVEAKPQMAALQSEAERRGIKLPVRFTVPDRDLWERGYAAEAARSLLPIAHTLDEALEVCSPFLDPLLDGSATRTWNPERREWGKRASMSRSAS